MGKTAAVQEGGPVVRVELPIRKGNRVPKFYEGDGQVFEVFDSYYGTGVHRLSAHSLVDAAYRMRFAFFGSFGPTTIAGAIFYLTGFHASRLGFDVRSRGWSCRMIGYDPYSTRLPLLDEFNDKIRPCHTGFQGHYAYDRDVDAFWLPRWTCGGCGRRAPRWPHECDVCDVRACSQGCHDLLSGAACYVCGARIKLEGRIYVRGGHVLDGFDGCTKRCRTYEASRAFTQLHARETRKWREHTDKPVCSPACHDVVAAEYRQITLELKEKREWVSQGKQLLAETEKVVAEITGQPLRRPRGRSRSHREGSTPPQSSAAS